MSFLNWLINCRKRLWPKAKKALIIIDGPNLYVPTKRLEIKVNYLHMVRLLAGDYPYRAILVLKAAEGKMTGTGQDFVSRIREAGIEVEIEDSSLEGDAPVDRRIEELLREQGPKYKRVGLVSGDEHFLPALKELKAQGVEVSVLSSDDSMSLRIAGLHPRVFTLQEALPLIALAEQRAIVEAIPRYRPPQNYYWRKNGKEGVVIFQPESNANGPPKNARPVTVRISDGNIFITPGHRAKTEEGP